MIYKLTAQANELKNQYVQEVSALAVTFFEGAHKKTPAEIIALYMECSLQWKKFCNSINRIRNWPVQLSGNEFDLLTRKNYEHYYLNNSTPSRRTILRTVRIIENLPWRKYIVRNFKLWFVKNFSK